MAIAAIALKRYHLRYLKYPAALDELVPEFLSEVPIDYLDGELLRYRVDEGSFLLWSVGKNRRDDEVSPVERGSPWISTVKDAIWPQPASEEEAAVYRKSQKKR